MVTELFETLERENIDCKDVLAALAYLHTVDILGATALIQQWDKLPT